MVYMEEDGSQHMGDSPTLFEKRVSSLEIGVEMKEDNISISHCLSCVRCSQKRVGDRDPAIIVKFAPDT